MGGGKQYLEPDLKFGTSYLEIVKDEFCREESSGRATSRAEVVEARLGATLRSVPPRLNFTKFRVKVLLLNPETFVSG